ncbi:hypothetical protein C0580_01910 [Candidatus Parcubacteria bacterium]|nr:MAG: hypothetical protein C0580_01910 [Candidatus Parcubacteria bacterium]
MSGHSLDLGRVFVATNGQLDHDVEGAHSNGQTAVFSGVPLQFIIQGGQLVTIFFAERGEVIFGQYILDFS